MIILIESKKHTVTAYTIISRNDNTYYLDVNIQDFWIKNNNYVYKALAYRFSLKLYLLIYFSARLQMILV